MRTRPRTHTAPVARDLDTLNLAWLTRLRWAAIPGQLATMAGASLAFDLVLPWGPLALVLVAEVILNTISELWLRRGHPVTELAMVGAMLADLLALTLLLFYTGGPTNPFNFLYLVHIALAAVIVRPRWTWALAILSAGLFALLFIAHEPLLMADPVHVDRPHKLTMHHGDDPAMAIHTL